MMACACAPNAQRAEALRGLIAGYMQNPKRELMQDAPGPLLAALFLHERSGGAC